MKENKCKREWAVSKLILPIAAFLLLLNVHNVHAQQQDQIFEVVEVMPEFPGGNDALLQYLSTNIKYPATAVANGTQGRVIVQFIVRKDGSVTDVVVRRSVDAELDNEAVRVVSAMPKWVPGKQRGQNVNVRYTVPVMFRLNTPKETTMPEITVVSGGSSATTTGNTVFEVVEHMPAFPGGMSALMQFLAKNIKYPAEAVKANQQGRVIVQFVVDKTGKVTNPSVIRKVAPSLDREAIRVVNLMPLWEPGMQKGEKVNVRFTVPISFAIPPKEATPAE